MANRLGRYFPKGGHPATQTENTIFYNKAGRNDNNEVNINVLDGISLYKTCML